MVNGDADCRIRKNPSNQFIIYENLELDEFTNYDHEIVLKSEFINITSFVKCVKN